MNNTDPIEWHEIKGSHVGMIGDEIVCIIDKMEDMPCEAYSAQALGGVFTSVDGVKASVEEALGKSRAQRTAPAIDYLALFAQTIALWAPILLKTANVAPGKTGVSISPEVNQK